MGYQLLPSLSSEEYAALKASIAEHGVLVPLEYDEAGQLLDGHHRLRACQELGLAGPPRIVRHFETEAAKLAHVLTLNKDRRHLSASQLACLAVDFLPPLEAEAAARQVTLAGTRKADLVALLPQGSERTPPSREVAADLVGVGARYVSDAKRLKEDSPALFEQVKSGELSLTRARRAAVQEQVATKTDWPTGKYRVIYADPPWRYGNTMPEEFTEQGHHYQLLTAAELALLPVKDLALDNAVLFLWATSPILPEAIEVASAWGFTYKASFVWDKVKHVMGHYNSVRHEFLLVCVRGSCQPDNHTLFDSVVTEERTEHSAKPATFRTIIDTIYPHGPRIELFARERPGGAWDVYGNDPALS